MAEKDKVSNQMPITSTNVVLNTERKPRTPRTYETIESGALALNLSQRVDLCKKLHQSIDDEVKELKIMADGAANIAQSLNGKS